MVSGVSTVPMRSLLSSPAVTSHVPAGSGSSIAQTISIGAVLVQSFSHPSPGVMLPSSHSSPGSSCPSPQTGSLVHIAEHPSPSAVLPSSHSSPASTVPSPHAGDVPVVLVVMLVPVDVLVVVVLVVGFDVPDA